MNAPAPLARLAGVCTLGDVRGAAVPSHAQQATTKEQLIGSW